MRSKVLSLVFTVLMGSACLGQLAGDDGINFIYDQGTGDVLIDSRSGPVTTFELQSASALFTGVENDALKGLFDVNSTEKVFKLQPAGFNELHLPGLLPPGTPCTTLFADISIAGSFAAGGSLSPVNFSFCPEPSGIALLAWAAFGFVGCRRRTRQSVVDET